MIFQGKDGELRLYEHGTSGVTRYLEILFIDANISGPVARGQTEERIVLDRGLLDANAHYVESDDKTRMEPLSLTFSSKFADTNNSQLLSDLVSGATVLTVGGVSYQMYSRAGKGDAMYGFSVTPPALRDSDLKVAYMVEVLYSGTSDWGFRWDETYFPPGEQTVAESEDALTVTLNGMVYGGVTTITAFTAGAVAMV
jgi:hypothetical protein